MSENQNLTIDFFIKKVTDILETSNSKPAQLEALRFLYELYKDNIKENGC